MSWYRQAFLKRALRLTIIFISSAIHGKAEPIKQARDLVCVPFCSLMFQLILWVFCGRVVAFIFSWKENTIFLIQIYCLWDSASSFFLERCCSSLLHREMHNMEIYVHWTMLDWPWKKWMHCRNSIWQMQMEKRRAWFNRKCLQPSRVRICLKEEGNGSQKGKPLLFVVAHKCYCAVFLTLTALPVNLWLLDMKSIQLPLLFSPAVLQHMLLFFPSVTLLWDAVRLSCTPTNFKSAFPPWAPAHVLKPHTTFHSLIVYSILESL